MKIEELTEVVRRQVARDRSPDSPIGVEVPEGATGERRPLEVLGELKDSRQPWPASSPPWLLGRFVLIAKRVYRRLFRPFINETLARQVRFNDQVHSILCDVERRLAVLESAPRAGEQSVTVRPEAELDPVWARLQAETSSAEAARETVRQYAPWFQECRKVVDLGCGRGPFLAVMREHGIAAYGVDNNADLVRRRRREGFEVEEGDAVDHLRRLSEGEVDGIFAGHLVEHLDLATLIQLFRLTASRLAPGGVFVFETPNTESLGVLASTYYRDPTRHQPRHPEAYRFLAEVCGFRNPVVVTSLPVPAELRLREVAADPGIGEATREALNGNLRRLNDLLFGPSNVAVVCRKDVPAT